MHHISSEFPRSNFYEFYLQIKMTQNYVIYFTIQPRFKQYSGYFKNLQLLIQYLVSMYHWYEINKPQSIDNIMFT